MGLTPGELSEANGHQPVVSSRQSQKAKKAIFLPLIVTTAGAEASIILRPPPQCLIPNKSNNSIVCSAPSGPKSKK